MPRRRAMIVGLDCLDPTLAFETYAHAMPNLSRLRAAGRWGRLRSTTPPITVPAWATMTSGRSPGALGLYGIRNRREWSYEMEVATARSVRAPRLWDVASNAGLRSIVLGVPPSYPPPAVHGDLVSCFLAPAGIHTHPASLAAELEGAVGPWRADVADFRTKDRAYVLSEIHAMTAQRFAAARHLASTRDWDLLFVVDMGPDRLHHAFWPPGDVGLAYYTALDRELGTLLALADESTTILVVSDHGARAMEGGIHVNDWLVREGWLVRGDWSRTRAWAEGGYYARIFLNVRGREPQGTIAADDVETVRTDLAAALAAIPDGAGRPMQNVVLRPDEAYDEVTGHPPDLLVFFGDLAWRALGSFAGRIYADANDTGPDGANHDWDGVLVACGAGVRGVGPIAGARVEDVTPTVLEALGLDPPPGLRAQSRL